MSTMPVDKYLKATYKEDIDKLREWMWCMVPLLQPSLDHATVIRSKRRIVELTHDEVRQVLRDTKHPNRLDFAILIVGNTYFNIAGCYVGGWYVEATREIDVSDHPNRFRATFNTAINRWAGFLQPTQEELL